MTGKARFASVRCGCGEWLLFAHSRGLWRSLHSAEMSPGGGGPTGRVASELRDRRLSPSRAAAWLCAKRNAAVPAGMSNPLVMYKTRSFMTTWNGSPGAGLAMGGLGGVISAIGKKSSPSCSERQTSRNAGSEGHVDRTGQVSWAGREPERRDPATDGGGGLTSAAQTAVQSQQRRDCAGGVTTGQGARCFACSSRSRAVSGRHARAVLLRQ
jgi:hypothetical protein